MDQVKIGRFIKELRKEEGLTQAELAERLHISDKTVSKWETGNGLPEVGLMLPLCEVLKISVNELLSAEKLDEKQYHQKAEENIMSLMKEKAEAKRKLILEVVVIFITLLSSITLIMLAGYLEMETWVRILLIVIAVVVMVGGILVAAVLEMTVGGFECRHCGEYFEPDAFSYLMGAHTIMHRRLKCPHCGKKSWCKRRLTKE